MPGVWFKVFIDWDNDGFAAGDEITAYALDVQTRAGMGSEITRRVADVGELTIRLNNADKRFSPTNASSPLFGKLKPNLPVRVQVTDGATTWTIFSGVTRVFRPDTGVYRERRTTLFCTDRMALLQDFAVGLPLQENKSPSFLLKMIMAATFRGGLASGTITFSANPANNDTVTVDGVVYTFKTALTPTANEVLIGADLYASIDNLAAAINGNAGAGTTYATGTTRPDAAVARATESWWEIMRRAKPLRWHRLGETAGTSAADRGQNGRAATYTGSTLNQAGALSGDPDRAVLHDGINDKVEMPVWDLTARSFAVALWVKPSSLASVMVGWFFYFGSGTGQQAFIQFGTSGEVNAGIQGGVVGSAGGVINAGTWALTVMSYDYPNQLVSFYVNDVLIGTAASAGMTVQPTFAKVDETFAGYLDEWILFDRTVTAAEVAAWYAARTVGVGVTIEAKARGTWGNAITLAEASANLTLSGATLSGGTDGAHTLDFETGRQTFGVAADQWSPDNTNGLTAVEDVVTSEWGLFWQGRDGTFIFRDRDYVFKRAAATAALTVTSQSRAEVAADVEEIFNRVVVSFTPRSVLAAGVVARARNTISVPGTWGEDRDNPADDLPAGGTTTVVLPYIDGGTGRTIGAKSLTLPLAAGVDYTINEARDETGVDYTNNGSVTFTVAATGSGVEVSFKNTALGTLYVFDLQVRGLGVVAYDATQITVDDSTSQDSYGRRTLAIDLALTSDESFGQTLARYLLGRYKTLLQRITRARFEGFPGVGGTNIFSLEIGDMMTITDTQAAISGQKYLIVGVQYGMGNGKPATTEVEFALRRLDDQTYWILQNATYGLLGSTTRLGI